MRHGLVLIWLAVSLFFSGCTDFSQKQDEESATARFENTQNYLMASTLFVQQSAEYRALCYQAFRSAEIQLRNVLADSPRRPAIVLDLDETVLDNSAYSAWQVATGNPYSSETWAVWTEMAIAPEVPGAGDFLRYADRVGVTLFYVSNRDSSALEPTMKNLRDLNIPQVKESQFMLKTNTSGKEERRKAIVDAGYEIVMLIGDNLGDFHEQWDKRSINTRRALAEEERELFGTRYIVLPNPIYGTWEGALYQYDRSFSDAERDSIRNSLLEPANISRK